VGAGGVELVVSHGSPQRLTYKRLVEAHTSLSLRSFKAHSSLVPIYLTTASHDHHMSSFIQYLPCASHEPSHDPPHISLTTLNTNLLILIGVLIPSLVPESIVQITTGKENSTQGQFGLTLVRPSTAMAGAPRSWAPTFLPGDTPEE